MTLAAPLSWRQEVFCAPQQLQELLARPAGGLIAGLNLPNKQKAELPQLLERARALRAVAPRLPVCVHFAISPHNWTPRDPEASYQTLRAFAHDLAAIEGCSLLLVSGGGPRKKMDSLSVRGQRASPSASLRLPLPRCIPASLRMCLLFYTCPCPPCPRQALERLAGDLAAGGLDLPLGVAFNPYFPDAERQQEERSRLRRKLQAGRGAVAAVYLQAGCDAARLDQSLQWLHGLLAELERGGAGQAQPPPPQQQEQEADGQAATRPPKRRRQQPRGPGAAASSAPAQEHACACGHRPQVVGSILYPQ